MKKTIFLLFIASALFSCKKKNTPPPILPPTKVVLIAPSQNAVCITGVAISDSQSSVTFSWNQADNADSYEVDIKNLLDNTTITNLSTSTQETDTLLRNTPYSWYVISKSSKTSVTTQSDTWKFYNSGNGVVSYAPFPAQLVSPAFAVNLPASPNTITLHWLGGSVMPNAVLKYDIYLGTTPDPPLHASGSPTDSLGGIGITSGNTYYWKVVTNDDAGNSSVSQVSQFAVK